MAFKPIIIDDGHLGQLPAGQPLDLGGWTLPATQPPASGYLLAATGTSAADWTKDIVGLTSLNVDNITIDGNAITSDTGVISFDNDSLETTGLATIGSLIISSGNLATPTGTFNFQNDNLLTTGAITGNNLIATGGLISSGTGTINFQSNDLLGTGDWYLRSDASKMFFGAGDDAAIWYDGVDFYFDSRRVGTGDFKFLSGDIEGINLSLSDGITSVDYIQFDTTYADGHAEGKLHWNSDDGTLEFGMPGGNVFLQMGQEILVLSRNTTGSQIANGTPVYISGSQANRPLIAPATAANFTQNGVVGLATEDIDNNSNGYVCHAGMVRDVNTISWAEGTLLWLDYSTPGQFTSTMPPAPYSRVAIGYVLRQHATEGIILASPTIIPHILNSSGVTPSTPADRDILQYNSSNTAWEVFPSHDDFFNGTFRETFNALLSSDGATITLSLEQSGGGDLTLQFSDGDTILDCTPADTIVLTAGTDSSPQANYIYIPQSTKVLTKSTSNWPSEEHIKVTYLLVPSATFVQDHGGSYVNQNWNDHLSGTDSQGHLSHMAQKIRRMGATWFSGVSANGATASYFTIGAGSTQWLSTSGVIAQMHDQTFPAVDMSAGDVAIVVNDNTSPYTHLTDLFSITQDNTGTTITNNRYFNLVFWGVMNKTGEWSGIMVNLPGGFYALQSDALNDTNGHDVFDIPRQFNIDSGTAFLIARATFQMGSTWSHIATTDLRGQTPFTASGGGVNDHGGLGGLTDDDHTQYLLADGTRPLTGDWTTGAHSLIGSDHWYLRADNAKMSFGEGDDAGIWYDGADMHIDPDTVGSGLLKVGSSLQVEGSISAISETLANWLGADRYGDHQYGPMILLRKSRGSTVSWTGINDGDDLGRIVVQGMEDTPAWPTLSAHDDAIRMVAKGAHTSTNHGRKITFRTIPQGYTNSLEALVIADDGNVGIGVTDPDESLVVNGDIHLYADSTYLLFGAGKDVGMWYDGANFYLNTQRVGSGDFRIPNGGIGLGDVGASLSGLIDVSYETGKTTSSAIGIYSTVFFGSAGSGNTTHTIYGSYANAQTVAAYDGNVGALQGFRNVSIHNGSGTITNMYGGGFAVAQQATGGAITNMYGLHVACTSNVSSDGTANMYGLYIDPIDDADTLNYSIYSNGGDCYFKGDVGVNVLLPNQKLHVGGNIKVDDNNKFVAGTGNDALIYYDGTDLIIDPDFVGSGELKIDGGLDVATTTGAITVPRMTTTQRTALTPANGMIVYDTTLTAFYFYENGSWVTK
jgi:hypothetical protein